MPFVPPDPLDILAALRVSLENLRQLAPLDPRNAPILTGIATDIEASIAKLESLAKPARSV
jgi:hypothetical protein